uniref:Uncharacterized protein n=1 Tax=Magallana gigas TaxID=29159 RepID=K1QT90_MAGGI
MSTSADVILTPKNVCGLGVHEYSIKPFKNVFVHNPFMEWPAYQSESWRSPQSANSASLFWRIDVPFLMLSPEGSPGEQI